MTNLSKLAADDEAWSNSYDDQQAANKAKEQEPPPGPFAIFTATTHGPVDHEVFHQALSTADRMVKGKRAIYHELRDLASLWFGQYKPGNPFQDAVARMSLSMLAVATMADHVKTVAQTGHDSTDANIRFADMYTTFQQMQKEFLAALKLAHHGLANRFINYLAGSASEVDLDDEIRKDVHDRQTSVLLTSAASLLKDVGPAIHLAVGAGLKNTKDIPSRDASDRVPTWEEFSAWHPEKRRAWYAKRPKPKPRPPTAEEQRHQEIMKKFRPDTTGMPEGDALDAIAKHDRRGRALKDTESRAHFTEFYGHSPEEEPVKS